MGLNINVSFFVVINVVRLLIGYVCVKTFLKLFKHLHFKTELISVTFCFGLHLYLFLALADHLFLKMQLIIFLFCECVSLCNKFI